MKRNLRRFSTSALAFMMLATFLLIISSAPVLGQTEDAASGAPVNGALADTGLAPKAGGIDLLLADTGGKAQININSATGVADFMRLPRGSELSLLRSESAEAVAGAFFARYGDAFGITNAASQLALAKQQTDKLGMTHLTYEQVQDGVNVFAGQITVHLVKGNRIASVNGAFIPQIKASAVPRLDAAEAGAIAINTVSAQQGAGLTASFSASQIQALNTTLYFYHTGLIQGIAGDTVLVYEVEVGNRVDIREFVFVNAQNGRIVDQFSGIHEGAGADREISETSLANVVWDESLGDPDPIPGGWAGGTPQQTTDWQNEIDGAKEIYNVIDNMVGYSSYDGAEATMRTVNNDPGISCPNANWNGISTNYCTDVTGDDTVAHEWGHAYTEYTHGLVYAWQPGALNESYSDIWGEIIDLVNGRGLDSPGGPRTDGACSVFGSGSPSTDNTYRWLSGEDDPAFGGAIRDLWNPACYGDPGKVSDTEYWCTSGDSGGVHTNSGVPNHAFALLTDGGAYNGQTITGIGLDKAAYIYWRAQSVYQSVSSGFVDHASSLAASCSDLIGDTTLTALSATSTPGAPIPAITAADCAELDKVILAVEFNTEPTQCGFAPAFVDAPPLCAGQGNGTVLPIDSQDWEAGMGAWTFGTHDVANPPSFTNPDWTVVGGLPDGEIGLAMYVEDSINRGACTPADTVAGALNLDSPVITIPATAVVPRVSIDHYVATESGWDGGNLKISVNGDAWTVVPDLAFEVNGYFAPGAINGGGNDNPLAGEEAWTGGGEGAVATGWGQSQVNLTGIAAAGDTIQLRFDMGLDGCNGVDGWYVDEVQVYSCQDEVPGAFCGDGVLDTGETCDDGNISNGDGCSDICVVEDGWACTDPTSGDPNGVNAVADWSFEGGVPNADWTPFSTFTGIAGFPFCGPDNSCPAAGVTSTGDWAIWIGGLSAGVTSSVTQTLTIPSTATDLTVQTLRGICDDPSDTLHVSIDGTDIGTQVCDVVDGAFGQITFPVAGFADDGVHELYIGGTVGGTNGTHTNFFVDDVTIYDNVPTTGTPSICTPIATGPFACNSGPVGFEDGVIPVDWSISTLADPGGEWLVSTDNSSAYWSIPPAPEGIYYASANDDAPGGGSDGSMDYLYTNIVDLSSAVSAALDFQYFFDGAYGQAAGGVQVSPDGGVTWDPEVIVPTGASWSSYSLDLSAYLGNPNVQVRFHSDDGGFWASGYAVDDISLNCEIPATLTCDGPAVGFEDGAFPFDWYIETQADPGGEWVVSTDNSSDYWDPGPAPEGIYYASANDDVAGPGSDGSVDYLYTNIIDLSGVGGASLNFQYYFDGSWGQAAGGVQVSPDGGVTWDPEIIVPTGVAWETYSLDLSAYAGNANVQVRFHSDDGGGWASGYAVDDVSLSCGTPIIDVNPASLASTLPPDAGETQILSIGNLGDADLNWYIEEAEGLPYLPFAPGRTPSATKGTVERVTIGDNDFSASGAGTGVRVTPAGAGEFPGLLTTITHSVSQDIVSFNSVSCNDGTAHTDNSYLRVFDLAAFGITNNFDVTEVQIGIEDATSGSGSQPLDVNLYTMIDPLAPLTFGNLSLIGTASAPVADQALTLLTVPVAGSAPAGSVLVVEVFTPDGAAGGNLLYIGSNPFGQTAPSYLAAVACGLSEPLDTAAIGFPDMHIVMNVTGDTIPTEPSACDAPSDLPWLSAAPNAGTTAPAGTTDVDVMFDSTGLIPGLYQGTLCVNSDDPVTPLVEVPVELTVEVTDVLYLSSNSFASAGGVAYKDEDIVTYDVATGDWAMYFDGSDVGLRRTDLDAMHLMDDGSILMSFNTRFKVPGFGKVDDSDIVRFIPTSLGENTAGTWEWVFDGSDVGLKKGGEDVDAIGFTPDGRLVVSTNASFKVPKSGGGKLLGADDDLIVLNGALGHATTGRWEMYFDGSDVWSPTEDVWGTWLDSATGDVYISMQNAFTAGSVSGDELDVVVCHPTSLGADTACTFDLYFDGSAAGYGGNRIDGFAIDR